MNILPLVIFSLIALAAFVSAFFQKGVDLTITHRTIIALTSVAREGERRIQDASYEKAKKKKEPKKEAKPSEKTKEYKAPPCPRELARLSSASKLNIYPLFTDQGDKPLEKILTSLIADLYAPLIDEAESVTKAIIHAGKKHLQKEQLEDSTSTSIWFDNLYPETSPLKETYYKMLRGTKHYNLEAKEGYPPLTHFVTFADTEKYGNFAALPPETLRAIFGSDATEKILAEEQKLREDPDTKQQVLKLDALQKIITDTSLCEHLEVKNYDRKDKPLSMKDPDTLITFHLRRD